MSPVGVELYVLTATQLCNSGNITSHALAAILRAARPPPVLRTRVGSISSRSKLESAFGGRVRIHAPMGPWSVGIELTGESFHPRWSRDDCTARRMYTKEMAGSYGGRSFSHPRRHSDECRFAGRRGGVCSSTGRFRSGVPVQHGVGQQRTRRSSHITGRKYRQRRSGYLAQNNDAIHRTFFFRLRYRNTTLHSDRWVDATSTVTFIVDGGSDDD